MKHECSFCKKHFSNKYILQNHQKNTKYCLKIQGNTKTTRFSCEGCSKEFTTNQMLNSHKEKCIRLVIQKYEIIVERQAQQFSEEKKQLARENKEQIQTIRYTYEKEIQTICEKHDKEIQSLQDRIEKLALAGIQRATTTTHNTTNTNILNLTPFDMNDRSIKDKIQEFYNLEYLRKGYRGVAEFTKENLLVDDNGKLKYVCCDPSRSIFKYRDENGEVRKDVKASRLTKRITPDIMSKAHSIVVGEVEKMNEESANIEFYNMYFALKELEHNPEKLGQELIKVVCT